MVLPSIKKFDFLCVCVQRTQQERVKRTSGWECQSVARAQEAKFWLVYFIQTMINCCKVTVKSVIKFLTHPNIFKTCKTNTFLSPKTCAHRYQRRSNINTAIESRDIIGRCYVLSQDLTINTGSNEEGGNWHFCESRHRGHEMFGSCQQGMSATFDKDFHYLIFGAPGAYNWKGSPLMFVVGIHQKCINMFFKVHHA